MEHIVKSFSEFINENIDVRSFKDFAEYKKDGSASPQDIIDRLNILDYDGELNSASIRSWLYDTFKVSFVCLEEPTGGYGYYFTTLRPNKLKRKKGEERYGKTKEVCYIISEYDYQKEDYMFMENLLEGLDWLIEITYNPDNPNFEHSIVDEPVDYTQYYKR